MDISIEDILGSSYTNSDDIIKISRKSYNLNSWENNIDEYSITDKEVITKIIKLIENMNVTLDNNYNDTNWINKRSIFNCLFR